MVSRDDTINDWTNLIFGVCDEISTNVIKYEPSREPILDNIRGWTTAILFHTECAILL